MNEKNIERREFIKKSAKIAGALGLTWGAGLFFHNRQYADKERIEDIKPAQKLTGVAASIIAVAVGEDPYALTKQAVEKLGGIGKFISRGDVVAIKPNIGWDRLPEHAANTNPFVVKALVDLCLETGAKEVRVGDVPCVDSQKSYQRSGIAKVVIESGGKIIFPEERFLKEVNFKGELIKNWIAFIPLLEADKIINVPIVKHHSLTLATIGMKNWFGIVSGPRNQLHQQVHEAIVDIAAFVRPVLTVIDGFRVLTRNGPQGGSLAFVKQMKTIAASANPVLADAFGAQLLGLNPSQLRFLQLAEKAGLGSFTGTRIN